MTEEIYKTELEMLHEELSKLTMLYTALEQAYQEQLRRNESLNIALTSQYGTVNTDYLTLKQEYIKVKQQNDNRGMSLVKIREQLRLGREIEALKESEKW